MESSTRRRLVGLRGFSIRLEPRLEVRPWLRYAVPLASLALALILGMVPMVMQGINPIVGYRDMVLLAFGSAYGISETIMKAIPNDNIHKEPRCSLTERLYNRINTPKRMTRSPTG